MRFWFSGCKRYGLEHYLYLGHRISGMGLICYLVMHIFVTASRIGGETAWHSTLTVLSHPIFRFFEYIVFVGFAFHALNGVRLALSELGVSVGKPSRPIYPYRSCVDRQRRFTWGLMVAFVAVAGLGAVNIFFWR